MQDGGWGSKAVDVFTAVKAALYREAGKRHGALRQEGVGQFALRSWRSDEAGEASSADAVDSG